MLDLLAVTRTNTQTPRATLSERWRWELLEDTRGRSHRSTAQHSPTPIDPDAATAPGQYDLATLSGLLDSL